jgi:hypothetical protein
MNNDDQEISDLRQKWDLMTHDEKVDKFLWKMVWYHHTKHVPGSPAQPIWDLSKVIQGASDSSEKLTRSIQIATWVAGVAAALGVILGFISFFYDSKTNDIKIGQKVFDECFDYYASLDRTAGIAQLNVQTCKEKAERWENEIR